MRRFYITTVIALTLTGVLYGGATLALTPRFSDASQIYFSWATYITVALMLINMLTFILADIGEKRKLVTLVEKGHDSSERVVLRTWAAIAHDVAQTVILTLSIVSMTTMSYWFAGHVWPVLFK